MRERDNDKKPQQIEYEIGRPVDSIITEIARRGRVRGVDPNERGNCESGSREKFESDVSKESGELPGRAAQQRNKENK